MKRLRLEKWPGQVGAPRPGAAASSRSMSPSCPRLPAQSGSRAPGQLASPSLRRYNTTEAFIQQLHAEKPPSTPPPSANAPLHRYKSYKTTSYFEWPKTTDADRARGPEPSPYHTKAKRSAKLSALHARLSLSDKIPLQTLARSLVDPTADPAPLFNNENLAFLGQTLISYYTSEMLICKYPRLPMEIMYAAMKAFAGEKTLFYVSRSWGVENAAAPGAEVDPGLLQFDLDKARSNSTKWGFAQPKPDQPQKFKRGISRRVIRHDEFGDDPDQKSLDELDAEQRQQEDRIGLSAEQQLVFGDPNQKVARSHSIHSQFVRAVVGAVYTHAGREAARSFIKAHVLSRQLDLAKLFTFKLPTRELARLCAREEFEQPVARLLSETGRLSRTPVFVVGIFSGNDKLGEGAAASLDAARQKASMNALKAWYLYSPGENVRVPSDMMEEDAKPWEPVYVDIGEVITPGVH